MSKDKLGPGLMELKKFQPSNFYAWTPNVSYTIWVVPSHSLGKTARVVVTMPTNLVFDINKPCKVDIPDAKCKVERTIKGFVWQGDFVKTRIVVSDIFKEEYKGGEMIKFTVSPGRNPTGAMPAGPYTVTTE